MSANSWLKIINKSFIILLIIATVLFFYRIQYIIKGFEADKPLKKAKHHKKFAVLIPARNESNVIARLLQSLKEQTYSKKRFDVYVIVEDIKDKTVEITKSYGYNYFVRTNLNNKGKGYALDECIQQIFKDGKDYDLMAVVDADNILAPNFLEEMNNASELGYQMGKGYHRQLNEEGNVVADCSTLTFSGMNTFQNKARTKLGMNIIASGTGFFIDFNIIKDLKGWPFHTLTEDYELSMYMTIHDMKTAYIPTTYYFDEQPTSLGVLRKQRVRWIKGYSQVNSQYHKELLKSAVKDKKNVVSKLDFGLGVIPNIIYVVSIVIYEAMMIGMGTYLFLIENPIWKTCFRYSFNCLLVVYMILQIYTILQLCAERGHNDYSFKSCVKIVLFNPIFICLYIPHAIEAMHKKNVSWDPIAHGQTEVINDETVNAACNNAVVEVNDEEEDDEVKIHA